MNNIIPIPHSPPAPRKVNPYRMMIRVIWTLAAIPFWVMPFIAWHLSDGLAGPQGTQVFFWLSLTAAIVAAVAWVGSGINIIYTAAQQWDERNKKISD